MGDEIISYIEMCQREKTSLQAGMNFGLGGNHSVILMSLRPNAPYRDRLEDGGTTLVYEGHDQPVSADCTNSKLVDQLERRSSGSLTQNGKFHDAAQASKGGRRLPERVRVYEKLRPGIWSYNGLFYLVDSWTEFDGTRRVFRFKLVAIEADENFDTPPLVSPVRRRIIPTPVKIIVWKRDGGKCVLCGSTDELHFDHDLPWSKGGTSLRLQMFSCCVLAIIFKKAIGFSSCKG